MATNLLVRNKQMRHPSKGRDPTGAKCTAACLFQGEMIQKFPYLVRNCLFCPLWLCSLPTGDCRAYVVVRLVPHAHAGRKVSFVSHTRARQCSYGDVTLQSLLTRANRSMPPVPASSSKHQLEGKIGYKHPGVRPLAVFHSPQICLLLLLLLPARSAPSQTPTLPPPRMVTTRSVDVTAPPNLA